MLGFEWLMAATGLFCLLPALFDWDWFFELLAGDRSGWILEQAGRRGARALYGALGVGLLAGGLLLHLWLGSVHWHLPGPRARASRPSVPAPAPR